LAQSKGLDLIEIAPTATPPVCRIVDYGKFRYEESKKEKDSRSRQPGNKMKELQLSAVIDPHDFGVKLAHAIEFLCDDTKVRVKLRFKGRQKLTKKFGFEVVNRFVREAAAYGHADSPPKMLGIAILNVLLTPLPRTSAGKSLKKAPAPPPALPIRRPRSRADLYFLHQRAKRVRSPEECEIFGLGHHPHPPVAPVVRLDRQRRRRFLSSWTYCQPSIDQTREASLGLGSSAIRNLSARLCTNQRPEP